MPVSVELVPRTASRGEWERYHAFRRRKQAERRPEDPLVPDDVTEMRFTRPDPFQETRRHLAVEGGDVVGEFEVEAVLPASPEYETNRHLLWAWAYVLEPYRRRGIGRSWLSTAVAAMDEHGATVLTTEAEIEPGFAFLRAIGAEARLTERESRLDLREVDWDMVARWLREARAASPDARLELFPQYPPDELLEELCAAATELMNTMPWEGLEHGDIVATPETERHTRERRAAAGTVNPSLIVRDADGGIVGMTDVIKHAYEPGIVNQNFTGVHPRARGRGIGKWIKAAMLLHIREAYPDTVWIRTGNAGSNAPMLGINHTLGFQLHRMQTYYQVSREALCRAV